MNKIKNLVLILLFSIICAAMIGFVACSAGAAGEKGETGDTGAQGSQGIKGESGEDGEDALTTYEIYLQYYPDYTGTEEEFYAAIADGSLVVHTVTADYGGTTEVITVKFGDKISQPETEDMFGYTYAWMCGDEAWNFTGYTVTEDITLTLTYSLITSGLQFTLNAEETACTVSGYTGSDTEIIIPETYNNVAVTEIGESVFSGSTATSITIPATVTTFGSEAFSGGNIADVYYLGTAQEWAQLSFSTGTANPLRYGAALYTTEDDSGYTLLTELTISENPASFAFAGCTSLTSLTIDDTVSKIGTQAFYGTTSLDVINYNTDLITGLSSTSKPFDGAGSSSGLSFIIGDSVTTVPDYLLYRQTQVTSLTIGSGVTSLGLYPFGYTTSLKTVYFNTNKLGDIASNVATPFLTAGSDDGLSIIVGEGVTRIANSTFRAITISSVSLPSTLTEIGERVFYNCSSLTSIEIPANVTTIGDRAFYGCTSLTSVTLPAKITTIGENVFYSCSAIETVNFGGTASQWAAIAFGNSVSNPATFSKSLNLLNSSTNKYELAEEITIDGITATSQYAFYNNRALTKVTIGSGVETIGYSSFNSCYSLANVILGDDVTTIDTNAFYSCKALTSITLPAKLATINSQAFYICTNLLEVYNLSSSLTLTKGSTDNGYVAYYALYIYTDASATGGTYFAQDGYNFYYDGTTYYLISYTGSTTDITLPTLTIEGVQTNYEVKQFAFYGNTSITSVTIPTHITTIGTYAFNGCSNLTAVYYDGTASQWASISFGNPSATPLYNKVPLYLSDGNGKYELAESITLDAVVNAYAFYYCTSILSVTIESNVTSIGTMAFFGCYQITEVVNNSSLSLTLGSNGNGYIANYANVICSDSSSSGTFITQGDYLFYRSAGNNYYLVRYNGSETELTLPTLTVEGSATTYIIKKYAFYAKTTITSLVIPDNIVKTIGAYAFYGCSGLTSVTTGIGITTIGEHSFQVCTKLEKAVISQGTLGTYTFYGCTKLTTLVLGTATTNVTSVGNYAFHNCSALTTIYYYGDSTAYSNITVSETSNDYFTAATVYYYSATQPTESGNYWYYDSSNNIVVWPAA